MKPARIIEGQTRVPGDKSISHRALLFSSVAEGEVEIEGLLQAGDTLSTAGCLKGLGVRFEGDWRKLRVMGGGLEGFVEPDNVLDAGNSGTTARLLAGLLAGQPFASVLNGDASLRKRPMNRVAEPLRQMGAVMDGRREGSLLPFFIRGGKLHPISYRLPVPSAQVKSAVLLAGLFADGITEVQEKYPSRDHTERMLQHLGADISRGETSCRLKGKQKLHGDYIKVPGDISSAIFLLTAAVLAPEGELLIEEVGVNPTRIGAINVLKEMGAQIEIIHRREQSGEPMADILARGGKPLKGISIGEETIPSLVDEVPVLAVAALFARGYTEITGAGELRVKETDRLRALSLELSRLGAVVKEFPEGLVIEGGARLRGAACSSHGDHRIAMALAVAALFSEGETKIQGAESVDISFPGFFERLEEVTR